MNKKKDYYEFTSYNEENQIIKESTIQINTIKKIIIIMISIITVILIIITRNVQPNIEKGQETQSIAMMQNQLEKNENNSQENKNNNHENAQENANKGNYINNQNSSQNLPEEPQNIQNQEQKNINEQKIKISKLPILTEIGIANMENIYHSDTKRAFLTFDDGPSNVTHQILDTLANEKIKATFFVLGSNVKIFPETTKRIYSEGHYIANHGYTHKYSAIYSSPQSVLDEYNMCNEEVKNAIGEPEYNSHLFRFPGGLPGGKYANIKQEAKELLAQNNILNIDWNALSGDSEFQYPEESVLMQRLIQTTQEKNSVVILMHDSPSKQVTADMLPNIIAYLKEQGYEFKTFYDIIQ